MMFLKGRLDVISLRPGHPRLHRCSYRISKTDEDMTIKDWKNVWTIVGSYLEATLCEAQELETG